MNEHDTIYVGTGLMDETQEGTYVYDVASAGRHYGTGHDRVEGVVSCDACQAVLYVLDHGRPLLVVPHISTEMFTGCLPCMVGAVVHGGGWLSDMPTAALLTPEGTDTPAPPVLDTHTVPQPTVITIGGHTYVATPTAYRVERV